MAARTESDVENMETTTALPASEHTADPLLGPEGVRLRPGNLMVKATIEVHTHMALNLYRGRQADPAKGIAPIIGLIRFAKESVTVWKGASMNDPVADYILVQCEEQYEVAEAAITESLAQMNSLLSSFSGLIMNVSESDKPVPVELNFASPWAWKGALLLRRFDEFCRAGMTARHLGLLSMKDWEDSLHRVARKIRRLFMIPSEYIFTGIRRDLWGGRIKRARKMYERANKSFPLIPDLVLKGIKRAQVSPPILRHMEIARREKQRQRASNDTWEGKSEGKSSDSEASGSLSDMPSHKLPVVETDKDPGAAKGAAPSAPSLQPSATRSKLSRSGQPESTSASWFNDFQGGPPVSAVDPVLNAATIPGKPQAAGLD